MVKKSIKELMAKVPRLRIAIPRSQVAGVLVLDGVELETVNLDEIGSIDVEPGKQVDLPPVTVFEPGNATLTFTPTEGALVEEFESGLHRAEVVYWRVDEGHQRAASFRWTFNVI